MGWNDSKCVLTFICVFIIDIIIYCFMISLFNLTFFVSMEFPIKFDTVTSGWSIVYTEGITCVKKIVILSGLSKQCRP